MRLALRNGARRIRSPRLNPLKFLLTPRSTACACALLIVPFGCDAILGQMHSAITRERGEFVQTTSGSMAVPEAARFRVSAIGTVVVRGGPETGISYTIRQHVKADSDAEARQLLRNIIVRNSTKAGWNILSVSAGDPAVINSEMYLTVPKSLRQAVVI